MLLMQGQTHERYRCQPRPVDMEGRIYDPEVGRFLSADPTVEYPNSSQGYNRYTYCNSNPLSFSDPTGYSYLGNKAEQTMRVAFIAAMAYVTHGAYVKWGLAGEFGAASIAGFMSSGGDMRTALLSGLAATAFTFTGHGAGFSDNWIGMLTRSMVEGMIGGAFTEAGGGDFGDGFVGSFVGSETSKVVDEASPNSLMGRLALTYIIGGTSGKLSGGNFSAAALAAVFQRLFNDEGTNSPKAQKAATNAKTHVDAFVFAALTPSTPTGAAKGAADFVGVAGVTNNGTYLGDIAAVGGEFRGAINGVGYFDGAETTTSSPYPTNIKLYELTVGPEIPFIGGVGLGGGLYITSGEVGLFFYGDGGLMGQNGSLGLGFSIWHF